jgi:hypothetical protein
MPALFKMTIADEQLRTVALCAPIVVSGLFYRSVGTSYVDWIVEELVIKGFLNPALCKLLARMLANQWVKSVELRARSAWWKAAQKVLPQWVYKKLDAFAKSYLEHHYLCQIVGAMMINAPLLVLNRKVTMDTMRAGLVKLVEDRYMPDYYSSMLPKYLTEGPAVAATTNEHLVHDYLDNPSNTYRLEKLRLQTLQQELFRDNVRLGRLRLWNIKTAEQYDALPIADKLWIAVSMGPKAAPLLLKFDAITDFRKSAGGGPSFAERRFMESEYTYIDRIEKATAFVSDQQVRSQRRFYEYTASRLNVCNRCS